MSNVIVLIQIIDVNIRKPNYQIFLKLALVFIHIKEKLFEKLQIVLLTCLLIMILFDRHPSIVKVKAYLMFEVFNLVSEEISIVNWLVVVRFIIIVEIHNRNSEEKICEIYNVVNKAFETIN